MAKQKKRHINISITEREHATILAALRLWQEGDEHNRGDLRDVAEAAGVPLGNDEIDALCERINFTNRKA
jgi:ribosomal protein L12E/L44/L45/RPP1/RPP2